MRALLFHCKNYKTKFQGFATRPKNVTPEKVTEPEQKGKDCVTAFITVEQDDDIEKCSLKICKEIETMSEQVGHRNIVIIPFAHLSNKIADSKKGLETLIYIVKLLEPNFNVMRAHFGSHKSLLLDVYGHPGNIRYREF